MVKLQVIPFLAGLLFFSAGCGTSRQASDSGKVDVDEYGETTTEGDESFDLAETSPYAPEEYNPSMTREHDLLHTTLRVSFDWSKSQMTGEATLKLTPYFYPSSMVTLDARGFDLREVALLQAGGDKIPLTYDYDQEKLSINLNREYKRGEEYSLLISYTAKPNDLPEGGSVAIENNKGLYFINPDGSDPEKPTQIWTQGETQASSCWFPTIDNPIERTTQEMYMTVDAKYKTVSNGELRSQIVNPDGTRTDYWVMEKSHAPYLFMMAVGDFAKVEDRWEGIPVDYYVESKYEPYARAIFGNTPEMLTFYSELLGVKYPWPKYSQLVVEDFVSGAMENTSATIHYGGLHRTDRELLDETDEDIVAHELFHQWFGDLVTCESWANIPLNEGFATYGEYLWYEHKYGRDAADYRLNNDLELYLEESAAKQEDLIRFGYDDREEMFDGHSYQKGGRVLHMLRKYLGDEAFFAGLNKYLLDNAYSDVEIHELRLAMEDISGQDLNWFFNQWFLASGHPILEVNYRQEEGSGNWVVNIQQVQTGDETPVYRLPMDIDVYVNGKPQRQRVELIRRDQDFPLNVSDVDWINVDAEKMILGVVRDNKPESWFALQLKQGPLFNDRAEAIAYYSESAEENPEANAMLAFAFDDPFWGIQEMALDGYAVSVEAGQQLADKMKGMAQRHKNSRVRVSALRNLGAFEDASYLTVFQEALNDSSWRVVANAMREIGRLDPAMALEKANAYENTENLNVMNAVLTIYAEHGGPEKNAVFQQKLAENKGWEQYLVIESYGDYLGRLEDPIIVVQGCQALAAAAGESDIWWMGQVAQGAIRNVVAHYETERQELAKSDDDFVIKSKSIDSCIAELEGILEQMNSN